jgi:hypothetical protein
MKLSSMSRSSIAMVPVTRIIPPIYTGAAAHGCARPIALGKTSR